MEIKRCYDTIIGASVGENQLFKNTAFNTSTESGITYTKTSDYEWTLSGTATAQNTKSILSSSVMSQNHVYYVGNFNNFGNTLEYLFNGWKSTDAIVKKTDTQNIQLRHSANADFTTPKSVKLTLIDLTAEFGSSIADYIYSLESATAGSGIAKLREWGFLKGYQAFNSGSLESVEVTGKKVVGFNQWDEEWEYGNINDATGQNNYDGVTDYWRSKNYIKVIQGAEYNQFTNGYSGRFRHYFYDADKNYMMYTVPESVNNNVTFTIPNGACFMRFRYYQFESGNHINCINLSNPDRNGEYEPYTSQTYDYGTDTLNGIFKLDANNNLYADGDVKTSDGMITRKYGIRAYQSGDESLADAFTNGIQTVYKLTTPTTEQGDPFASPQIVYPDGTEEYVTETGVPVGHETRYEL